LKKELQLLKCLQSDPQPEGLQRANSMKNASNLSIGIVCSLLVLFSSSCGNKNPIIDALTVMGLSDSQTEENKRATFTTMCSGDNFKTEADNICIVFCKQSPSSRVICADLEPRYIQFLGQNPDNPLGNNDVLSVNNQKKPEAIQYGILKELQFYNSAKVNFDMSVVDEKESVIKSNVKALSNYIFTEDFITTIGHPPKFSDYLGIFTLLDQEFNTNQIRTKKLGDTGEIDLLLINTRGDTGVLYSDYEALTVKAKQLRLGSHKYPVDIVSIYSDKTFAMDDNKHIERAKSMLENGTKIVAGLHGKLWQSNVESKTVNFARKYGRLVSYFSDDSSRFARYLVNGGEIKNSWLNSLSLLDNECGIYGNEGIVFASGVNKTHCKYRLDKMTLLNQHNFIQLRGDQVKEICFDFRGTPKQQSDFGPFSEDLSKIWCDQCTHFYFEGLNRITDPDNYINSVDCRHRCICKDNFKLINEIEDFRVDIEKTIQEAGDKTKDAIKTNYETIEKDVKDFFGL